MLGGEVEEPKRDSWVLLVIITRSQSHLSLHRAETCLKVGSNLFDLLRIAVELFQVHHDRRHALNDHRSHVLLQILSETLTVEISKADPQVRIDTREALDILIEDSLDDALIRLGKLAVRVLRKLDALGRDDLLVGVKIG